MSANAGWYPDPGGGQGLYRYWDGQSWSAATTGNPASAPPPQGIVNPGSAAGTAGASAHANYGQGSYGTGGYGQGSYGEGSYGQGSYGQGSYGQGSYGQGSYGQGSYGQSSYGQQGSQGGSGGQLGSGGSGGAGGAGGSGGFLGRAASGGQPAGRPGVPAYAQYQARKRSGLGWWVGAGVVALVLVVVAVFAIRAATSGSATTAGGGSSGQATSDQCPPQRSDSPSATAPPADGRVHGGPVSYPQLGSPWSAPTGENRVPFGVNVVNQTVTVEPNYDGTDSSWVASVTVGELQAGDGFFTPEQGSQIVVRCILGAFYGNNPVNSDVIVNKATTIDGHEAWLVESKLTFDIPNLQTKGERLIVAIVQANEQTSGLYYASIPDTTPQLLQPARDALEQLTVDG